MAFVNIKNIAKKQHVDEECEDLSPCRTIKLCNKRHPKACRRFVMEQFCKFRNDCSYEHSVTVSELKNYEDSKKIELLENEVKSQRFRSLHIIGTK